MVRRLAPLIGGCVIGIMIVLLPWVGSVDALLVAGPIDPTGSAGWVLRVVAVVTAPVVQYVIWIGIGFLLIRWRLRILAGVVLIAVSLAFSSHQIVRAIIERPRPSSLFAGTITYSDFSFPSGHMTASSMTAGLIVIAGWVLRIGPQRWWAACGWVGLVGLNRWAMNAHWISDIITGTLLGATCVALAVAIAQPRQTLPDAAGIAVVFHPGRIPRWLVQRCTPGALLLPTAPDDPGVGQARRALDADAERVLVAGGDGTLRHIASVLAGSRTPIGVLPMGSGNVLASNLGLPVDLVASCHVALTGTPCEVNVLLLNLDGRAEVCLSMAGVGADAAVLADTPESWKRVLGPFAYAVAGLGHLRPHLVGSSVGSVSEVLVGNVSSLRDGLVFFPGASPQERCLDVLIARPTQRSEVLSAIFQVLLRRSHHRSVTVERASSFQASFDTPILCQIDGDVLDRVSHFEVSLGSPIQIITPSCIGKRHHPRRIGHSSMSPAGGSHNESHNQHQRNGTKGCCRICRVKHR